MEKMVEQYQAQAWNIKVLKIGDTVVNEHHISACVGPFVRLQETREICFLTSYHSFERSDIYNGMKVVYFLPKEDQYFRGEVIMTSKKLDAVLVKLSDGFIPKHCIFIDVDSHDLFRAGLEFPYKIKGTRDLRKRNPNIYIGGQIVVHCNGRLLSGKLDRLISVRTFKAEDSERQIVLHNLQSFIPDTDSPEFLPGSSGSAVFLVEDNNSLSCIGILIGMASSKQKKTNGFVYFNS